MKGRYMGSEPVKQTSNIFTRDLAKAREDTRRNYERGALVPPPQTAKISFDFQKRPKASASLVWIVSNTRPSHLNLTNRWHPCHAAKDWEQSAKNESEEAKKALDMAVKPIQAIMKKMRDRSS
jgi:hypothetical protein